jgi:hypothetical protein
MTRHDRFAAAVLVLAGIVPAFAPRALAVEPTAAGVNAAPATEATWKSINSNVQQLDALIKAGKLDDLGSSAYGIANLVKTLPAQSGTLPPDKVAQVSATVKVVGGEVSKLDKAGESGDKAAVAAHFKSLQDTLATLHAVYFAGPAPK